MSAKRPVILVGRKLPQAVEARLRRDYDARLNDDDRLYSAAELIELAQGADAIVPCPTERLSDKVIAQLPRAVRIVATYSVGYDHIDIAAAKARGLVVTNTPDVLSDATAEIAMLLILGAARRASEGDRLVRSGAWKDWSPAFMVGTQITGKRLGIVGMGGVGRALARRARGFDMQIHYHNRSRLDRHIEAGALYHRSLEDLLRQSDILSLNCPATDETRHLLNEGTIAWLPNGAVIVNTARGTLVKDEDLIAALRSGKLAAAGLDVFAGEPDIHPDYRKLDNVFLLPHIGSATRETRDAMGFRALDNLDAFFGGKAPPDRVA